MSCGCEKKPRWASKLGRLRGLPLCAGSKIRVGFDLSFSLVGVGNDFKEAVEGCLYASGGVASIEAIDLQSGYIHVYVLVKLTTAVDFADKEDVGNLVAGVINQCGGVQIATRYPVEVDATPAGAGANCQPVVASDQIPITPNSQKGIFDQLLGQGSSGGILLIGGIALVALLVLKK